MENNPKEYQTFEENLLSKQKRVEATKGDGHCFINSVLKCLKHKGISYSLNDIREKVKKELTENISFYSNFYHQRFDITELLHNYFDNKMWNNDFGDLLIIIVVNALKISAIYVCQLNIYVVNDKQKFQLSFIIVMKSFHLI